MKSALDQIYNQLVHHIESYSWIFNYPK
uniref:Uncharacterized protein n=1 Tax=Rhizophora mucronata TaxID=61149 RepID=A0A2P2N422_RHIMU